MLYVLLSLCLLAPPQTAATADPSAPTQLRTAAASDWSIAAGPTASGSLAAVELIESSGTETAVLGLTTAQSLGLALHDGIAWGGFTTLTSDTGHTSSEVFAGEYEQRTGRLLMVYRKGTSALVYFRISDRTATPTLASEDWFDLGLPAAPDRLVLVPHAGSDAALLVGISGATVRAAIWDGSTFGNSHTLDSGFNNGHEALAAEWQSDEAVVLWARDADTSPRGVRFDGDTWASTAGLPDAGFPIDRLELAPSNDKSLAPLLLAMIAFDGANHGLHAATHDGTSWSTATTLATQLESTKAASIAWEASGTNAIATWQTLGETTVRMSRLDAGSWSAPLQSTDLGGSAERVLARPSESDSEAVQILASISSTGAALTDYVAYADTGSLTIDPSTTVTGTTGAGEGHTLPTAPNVTPGSSDISIKNNKSLTLAPGNYDDFSIGNKSTLNVTAGEYVFDTWSVNKNSFTINADTASGSVRIIVDRNGINARNSMKIITTGPNAVEIHLLGGDFDADNSPTLNASILVYNGSLTLGSGADIDGHLLAANGVTVGGSGTIDPPSWNSPFADPSPSVSSSTELVGLSVTAGVAGGVSTLATGWTESWALPFDLSWARPAGGNLRMTQWREVPSYDSTP